jgi:hypothetical protein
VSIEKLIRDANPVRNDDLVAGDSPHARRALAQILQEHADPRFSTSKAYHPAGLQARRVKKGTLMTVGLAVTAAGVAVAVLLSAAPGVPPRAAVGAAATPRVTRPPRAHAPTAQPMTARQILLTAAAHVAGGPATGKYWRVTMIGGVTVPGGTKANPYDISLRTYADQWNPISAGRKEWQIFQQLGTRPATPADASSWSAAGSPKRWHSGLPANNYLADYPLEWIGKLTATTAASARSAAWQVSDGTVGFVEGDLAGLKAAQFRRMPTRPPLVKAILRHYALRTGCGQNPGLPNCSTVDQLIWAEALMLLQDPVSAPVRSATFKVMAGLPGVRLIGQMIDPLGRPGYALAPGSEDSNANSSKFHPTRVVLIDPGTGSLLATEEIGPMPLTVHCLSFDAKDNCTGPAYYGRSYPDQVDDYVAVVSEGWTNASPALPSPSTWSANQCCAGLPPLP